MRSALVAGGAYFAIVFIAGFLLGTVRNIAVEPAFGAFRAVLLELPFMLAASWICCGAVIRRFSLSPALAVRAAMGATAFGLLMIAELLLGAALGGSPSDMIDAWRRPPGAAGLFGQILFALFPLLRMRS